MEIQKDLRKLTIRFSGLGPRVWGLGIWGRGAEDWGSGCGAQGSAAVVCALSLEEP